MSRQPTESYNKNYLLCIVWLGLALLLSCSILGFTWAIQENEETFIERDREVSAYPINVEMNDQIEKTEKFSIPLTLEKVGSVEYGINVQNNGESWILVQIEVQDEADLPLAYRITQGDGNEGDNPVTYRLEAGAAVSYVLIPQWIEDAEVLQDPSHSETEVLSVIITCTQISCAE
jgi:hypothetical protein